MGPPRSPRSTGIGRCPSPAAAAVAGGRQGLVHQRRRLGDPDRRREVLEDPRQVPAQPRPRRLVDQRHHRGQGDKDKQQGAVADPDRPAQPDPPPAPPAAAVATTARLEALGVAAQTAQQCHATLNRYRAKAGLDKASSTSIPALAKAAARHAAYRVNVDPGDSVLLAALGLPDLACSGPT